MLGRVISSLRMGSVPLLSFRGSHHQTSPKTQTTSTIHEHEVKKFSDTSMWDPDSLLHALNALRVPFVRDGILSTSAKATKSATPLKGYRILDVGSGGGILTEPLARLGASVTGLEPSEANIKFAMDRIANDDAIKGRITYTCGTVETLDVDEKFDAVVCSEVIEHVANVDLFLESCVNLTKEGGSLFFTTLNRTAFSYIAGILLAEYVLRLVPRGTHEWEKFVPPQILTEKLQTLNCRVLAVNGIFYNVVTRKFFWVDSTACNYALHAVK